MELNTTIFFLEFAVVVASAHYSILCLNSLCLRVKVLDPYYVLLNLV